MRRRRSLCAAALGLCGLLLPAGAPAHAGREVRRPPLFIYLHVLQPLEKQAMEAHAADEGAMAYRFYLRALRGYQALDSSVGEWSMVEPKGLRTLVHASIDRCEAAVTALRPAAEAEDALLQRLNQPINLDVDGTHIRDVCRMLTELTDVNLVLDDTLFPERGPDPGVTLRVDREVPLLQVIRLIVQQKGLAYAIEEEYVYISTRTGVDAAPGFSTSPWFQPN